METELEKNILEKVAEICSYETGFNRTLSKYRIKSVCELVLTRKNDSALEIGCGEGFMSRELSKFFSAYHVIEPVKRLAEIVKTNTNKAVVYNCIFETFEAPRKFDYVFLCGVLEHVLCSVAVLAKIKSLLAPGGSLIITVPNAESLHRRYALAANMMEDITELGEADFIANHRRYYTLRRLESEIEQVFGSEALIETRGLMLKPFPNSDMLKLDDSVVSNLCNCSYVLPARMCAELITKITTW